MRFSIGSLAIGLAVAALPSSLSAQSCGPTSGETWQVASNFKGDKARTQLSGAACDLAASPPQCLIVNDEKTFAQRFTISGATLVPGAAIDLIEGDDEPDAEGAAFSKGSFYVTGSHGNSRKKNKPNEASYVLVRIDAQSGKLDRSGRWRKAIFASPKLGPYAAQPLKDGGPDKAGGANVEGIALWENRMYLGFRGPSVGNRAFILSAPESEVFANSDAALAAADHEVELGARAGIRDLAAVSTGLLILSGPVNDEEVAPAIFHWNPTSGKLARLADVTVPAGAKAETLLVLKDGKDDTHFQVLLIFEGPTNGAPVACRIMKPKKHSRRMPCTDRDATTTAEEQDNMIGMTKRCRIACLAAVAGFLLAPMVARPSHAQQAPYQPDAENLAVLGTAVQKLAGAAPIPNNFTRKPRFLAKLKAGQVWIDSELQLDTDGWPGGKGNTDPTWQPETSWSYTNDTPINANSVPYFVLPKGGWEGKFKIKIGDYAAVLYKGRLAYAVFADRGDESKLGEGSIQLLRQLGEERITSDGKIINKGMGPGIITIVFPGSGSNKRFANEAALLKDLKAKAEKAFVALGGNPSAAK